MPDSLLLPKVTLRVVLAWLLKLGGTKRLPTTSPSGDLGSSTIPLEVRLPRLMTTGLAAGVRDGKLLIVSIREWVLCTGLELTEEETMPLTEGKLLPKEALSSGELLADRDSSEDSREEKLVARLREAITSRVGPTVSISLSLMTEDEGVLFPAELEVERCRVSLKDGEELRIERFVLSETFVLGNTVVLPGHCLDKPVFLLLLRN